MNSRGSIATCSLLLGLSLLALAGGRVSSGTAAPPNLSAVGWTPFGAAGGPTEYLQYQPLVSSTRSGASLTWAEIEPSQDRYTWTVSDRELATFRGTGLEPMLKLRTCGRLEDAGDFWGTAAVSASAKLPPGICASLPPVSMARYNNYISRVIKRYKDPVYAGAPVRYLAIGNEVNDGNQWPGTPGRRRCVIDEASGQEDCPVFQDYLKLLRSARGAAHSANPNVIVMDSGLGSRVFGVAIARDLYEEKGKTAAALQEAIAFYNKFYSLRYASPAAAGNFYVNPSPKSTRRARFEATIYAPYDPEADSALNVAIGDRFYYFAKHIYDDRNAIDAIQLHAYDHWDLTDEVIDWMHRQMDENWGPGKRKPILCWECGSHHPLADSNGDGFAEYVNYDVDDHASWIAKRFVLGLSRGVQQLVHHKLVWNHRPQAGDPFESPPLICGPGSQFEPKLCGGVVDPTRLTPHGKVFKKLASTLVGYTSVTELSTFGSAVKAFRFAMAGGAIVTLWSADGTSRTVNLTQLGSIRTVTDQYGVSVAGSRSAAVVDEKVTYVKLR